MISLNERQRLQDSLNEVHNVLVSLSLDIDELVLYDELKRLHEAAIEPWCVLVSILRDRIPARSTEPEPQRRATLSDFEV